jgi:hypothetical protein
LIFSKLTPPYAQQERRERERNNTLHHCHQMARFQLFLALLAFVALGTFLAQPRRVGSLYKPNITKRKKDHWHPRWSPPEGSITMELNPNSTMREELVGIYHVLFSSSILVVIKADTSSSSPSSSNTTRPPCLRPYLMGRLSGPALGMVMSWSYSHFDRDSVDDNDTNSTNLMTKMTINVEGQYRVPLAGVYSLEVIVIMCNTWEDEAWHHANSTEIATQLCIEDPRHHRLTTLNVSIEVIYSYPRLMPHICSTATSSLSLRTCSPTKCNICKEMNMLDTGDLSNNQPSEPDLPGYWMRRHVNDPVESAVSALAPPLFTRFQLHSCPKSGPYTNKECDFATNLLQSAPTSERRRTDGAPTNSAFVDDVVSSKPREKQRWCTSSVS